jgi:hypothetical protein
VRHGRPQADRRDAELAGALSGQSIFRVSPSTSDTCGRTAWKSKNPSGSISAKRAALHCLARYAAPSDAPWPPSFQPRNAAMSTGRRKLGANETVSSDIPGV